MSRERQEITITDQRLVRLAWIPALVVAVIAMFALEGKPDPVDPLGPTGIFEGREAATVAREIVRDAPEREAGSPGDEAVADLVIERFRDIPSGAVAEQRFESDGRELRNVVLTLPGDPETGVAVLAARDAESSPAAASSAASTGVLVELARTLGVTGRDATYLLGSTTGGPDGLRAFLEALPSSQPIDTVVTLSNLGARTPEPPHAVVTSTKAESGPLQLRLTAEGVIEDLVDEPAPEPSLLAGLARLAFPSGLGPQATLNAEGVDAVGVTAAGERPLAAADDQADDLSRETLVAFGRAAHALVGAIDIAGARLEHGPTAYVEVAGNIVPGWSISALALALLLPALVGSIDAAARVARRRGPLLAGVGWSLVRALPLVGMLAVLYGLALVGLVPRPEFPFDPGLHPIGARAAVTFALIGAAAIMSAYAIRRLGVTGREAPAGAVAAVGLIASAAVLALWLANPYLALLFVPFAHVWFLVDAPPSGRRATFVTAAALAAVLPVVLALGSVADSLGLGEDAPWTLTLMVADGQIGLAVALPALFAAGALLACVALAIGRSGLLPAGPRPAPRIPPRDAEEPASE